MFKSQQKQLYLFIAKIKPSNIQPNIFYLQPKCGSMSSTNVTFKETILDDEDLDIDIMNVTAMFDIEYEYFLKTEKVATTPFTLWLWRLTLPPGKVVPPIFFHENDRKGCKRDYLYALGNFL